MRPIVMRESGGTMISSAYKLAAQLIDEHYPSDEWNIYPFHFSDGDNWSMDDTLTCVELLKKEILPKVNLFAYHCPETGGRSADADVYKLGKRVELQLGE